MHRHVCALLSTQLTVAQVGDKISAGDMYATVHENRLMEHKVLLPPNVRGNITYIAPAGEYNITENVIEIEFNVRTLPLAPTCLSPAMPLSLHFLALA